MFVLDENAVERIRALHALDGEKAASAVNELREWALSQKHFKKKVFSDRFLENVIISSKGSPDKSRTRLEKYCTARSTMPKFFDKYDVRSELSDVISSYYLAMLPKYTEEYSKVLIIKIRRSIKATTISDLYRYAVILIEYLMANDCFNGLEVIADYEESKYILEVIMKISPTELAQVFKLFMNGYGLRVKGIHLLTESKLMDVLVKLMKKLVSTKIGNRFQVHRSLESLYTVLNKDILPLEYGGRERSIVDLHHEWIERLSVPDHIKYLKILKKVGVDESKRSDQTVT